eukprot:5415716-Alexandrium_andersonii.AAC.1
MAAWAAFRRLSPVVPLARAREITLMRASPRLASTVRRGLRLLLRLWSRAGGALAGRSCGAAARRQGGAGRPPAAEPLAG